MPFRDDADNEGDRNENDQNDETIHMTEGIEPLPVDEDGRIENGDNGSLTPLTLSGNATDEENGGRDGVMVVDENQNDDNDANNNHDHVHQTDLVVARPINEDDDEYDDDGYLFTTVYDPFAKPPSFRNRRFPLYASAGLILLLVCGIVAAATLVFGGSNRRDDPSVGTNAFPTSSPTFTKGRIIREEIRAVYPESGIPGSPHQSAADWMVDEDLIEIDLSGPRILQRYRAVLVWITTTNNGDNPWNFCNKPIGNDASCEYTIYSVDEFDVLQEESLSSTRWLSIKTECSWYGIGCDGGGTIRFLTLGKYC